MVMIRHNPTPHSLSFIYSSVAGLRNTLFLHPLPNTIMLLKAALCLFNLGLALAAPAQEIKRTTGRTSAPSGALVVGSGKTYTKIQDAVDALSTSSTTAQSIFIESGTYDEQVTVPSLESALTIYGYTTDTSSYSSNVVTISSGLGLSDVSNDDETATLRVHTENFKMYNINVKNTRGEGDIALALSAYSSVSPLSTKRKQNPERKQKDI